MPVTCVRNGKDSLITAEALEKAAECLRTLAHPQRLRLVELLLHGRYTVGELAEACGLTSPVTSGHLRLMQHCGMLRQERDGRNTYYQIAQPCLGEFLACVKRHFDSGKA